MKSTNGKGKWKFRLPFGSPAEQRRGGRSSERHGWKPEEQEELQRTREISKTPWRSRSRSNEALFFPFSKTFCCWRRCCCYKNEVEERKRSRYSQTRKRGLGGSDFVRLQIGTVSVLYLLDRATLVLSYLNLTKRVFSSFFLLLFSPSTRGYNRNYGGIWLCFFIHTQEDTKSDLSLE